MKCVYKDDVERVINDLNNGLKLKGPLTGEYRLLSKVDNTYHWFYVQCKVVLVSEGIDLAYFVFNDINDLMIARNQIEASKDFYRDIVKAAKISTWIYDIDKHEINLEGNIQNFNEHNFGNQIDKISDVPNSLLIDSNESEWEKIKNLYNKVNRGENCSEDFWNNPSSGREPYCERVTYIIQNSNDGKFHFAIGLGQNVTEEKKAEEHYQREKGLLRDLEENNLLAKGHYDLTKNVVLEYETKNKNVFNIPIGDKFDNLVNALAKCVYRKSEKEILLRKLNRDNLIKEYSKGNNVDTIIYHHYLKGKTPVTVSVSCRTYLSPETGDIELFTYAFNITENSLYDDIMSIISNAEFDYIGLIFVDSEEFMFIKKSDSITYPKVNERVSYESCRNYVKQNFINPDETEQFMKFTSLSNILENLTKSDHYVATYHRSENNQIYSKQNDYLWYDKEARIILAVRTDVTISFLRDREQMARIEASKLEADRANEAKTAFLSSMSHDLRTPLNGVIGFTKLALKETDPNKKQEYLNKIDSSSQILLNLINDTLEVSRIDSGKSIYSPEACDPKELIPSIVVALSPEAEAKGVDLFVDYTNYPNKPIWCDRLKTQKIFLNLLSNAIKYTHQGGQVFVTFSVNKSNETQKYLTFTIKDNGIGMSSEFMKHMYEPFSQENRSESSKVFGTGLGLSIVNRFVDILNGTIKCESVIYKGTTFTVSLPISIVETEDFKSTAIVSNNSNSLKNKHILLFEDNSLNREIALVLLKEKGMIVDTAEDGVIGLKMFMASKEHTYDAILMDIRMPHMGGLEASENIRKLERSDNNIPIIAMSADAFEESFLAAKAVGINGYITKPIIPEKMFEELSRLIK